MTPHQQIEPKQFEALLYSRLSEASGPLLLTRDLSEQELEDTRTLTNARRFLQALREEAPVRATKQLGYLSRSFATRMFRELEWSGDRLVEYLAPRKHVDEVDLPALYQLRVMLQRSGLVRKQHGAFHLTKRAERLLDRKSWGDLYRTLFLGWFDKTNIALADGLPEDPTMQTYLPFTLWVLHHKAREWKMAAELAPNLPHDEELWASVEYEWRRRFGGTRHGHDLLRTAIERRILDPLVDFGLMERDPDTSTRWDETARWKVTPLFSRFITFDFSALTESDDQYNGDIVALKITLKGTQPPVWRRVEMPASYDLAKVHSVLNAAMGWLDYHLHEFDIEGRRYGIPDADLPPEGDFTIPEERVILGDLSRVGVRHFTYGYDFGDGWMHSVTIESMAPAEPGVFYPRCTDGRRAAVPEDCGGVSGFAEFMEAMASTKHPEHAELKSWYGGDYDPAAFSAEEISRVLRAVATGLPPHGWAGPA
jgi:hypothetical protein